MLRPHVHTRGSVSSSDVPGMEQSRGCGAHASACTEVPAGPSHAWTVSLVPAFSPPHECTRAGGARTCAGRPSERAYVVATGVGGRRLFASATGCSAAPTRRRAHAHLCRSAGPLVSADTATTRLSGRSIETCYSDQPETRRVGTLSLCLHCCSTRHGPVDGAPSPFSCPRACQQALRYAHG